jgi:L-threonylcarbamoyladenylate synthase
MIIIHEAPDTFDAVSRVLGKGGVVIMKCDTIYGIVGISPASLPRISRIKNRDESKPFLNLIGDISWLKRFTADRPPEFIKCYWPGPLTLIFHAVEGGTIALRVPQDTFLRRLLQVLDRPLVSTSVNRSGDPPQNRIVPIVQSFETEADLIVDAGDLEKTIPSTVLDLTTIPYSVVRRGRVNIPKRLLNLEDR